MSDIELKPCPFCGGEVGHVVWSMHDYHRAECEDCDISMDYFHNAKDLEEAWNRRAPNVQK